MVRIITFDYLLSKSARELLMLPIEKCIACDKESAKVLAYIGSFPLLDGFISAAYPAEGGGYYIRTMSQNSWLRDVGGNDIVPIVRYEGHNKTPSFCELEQMEDWDDVASSEEIAELDMAIQSQANNETAPDCWESVYYALLIRDFIKAIQNGEEV